MASDAGHRGLIGKIARKCVQLGFLGLFLYPFVPVVYTRLTQKPAPTLTSWLLPWDPLLSFGQVIHFNWTFVIVGAPLLLIAGTLILGRFFCGWVCPLGTLLDLVRPLAFWQKRGARGARRSRLQRDIRRGEDVGLQARPTATTASTGEDVGLQARPTATTTAGTGEDVGLQARPTAKAAGKAAAWFSPMRNSAARYYVLAASLLGGLVSLQILGTFDPLVILQRAATVVTSDAFALGHPAFRIYLTFSLVFAGIVVLELWQPRFWCRHLCPLGALLSLFSRWSLLNRRVDTACNRCGECRRACTMRAIPQEGHDTEYADCHFCLECEADCPKGAISFGFGTLASKRWQAEGKVADAQGKLRLAGRYMPAPRSSLPASRRQFFGAAAAGVVGLIVTPLLTLAGRRRFLRPPGALPEDEFLRTCILCQECVRVCPTAGLKPVGPLEAVAGAGTPQLVPRQGACALTPSCPHLCAKACPVGAIRPIEPQEMRLGIAVVEHAHCLAWDQGVKCLVCVEACLFEAAQAYNGRITVNPEKCTGCGRCENACPVAGSAIRVYPHGPV